MIKAKKRTANKGFGKMRADVTQHQLLFCYCAAVVGPVQHETGVYNHKLKNSFQIFVAHKIL